MGWETRLAWSGEQPATGAVLLQRFNEQTGTGPDRAMTDATGKSWTIRNWTAATANLTDGRWRKRLRFNINVPATEKTSLLVPHFAGMWPSSGKVLLYAWAALGYAMQFTPIISTRNTAGKAPLVYLSTMSDGRPRSIVYNAAGTSVLDQAEALPWTATPHEWVCYMLMLDMDAQTSQIALVRHTAGDSYVAPLRTLAGSPNAACEADFAALTLSPTASYWANGRTDEMGLWHLGADFDFEDFVEQVRLSTWASGADTDQGVGLTVSDEQVSCTADGSVLHTGAEHAAWTSRPDVQPHTPIGAEPLALLSTDDGATWSAPTAPDELPGSFEGLVRWQVPLDAGETFNGLALVEPPPVPTLDAVAPVAMDPDTTAVRTLTGSWTGQPSFRLAASGVSASITGTTLSIHAGHVVGDFTVTVWIRDETGQESEPLVIVVDVNAPEWIPRENPVFARAPLIIHDANGRRDVVLHDPAAAAITTEVNGEQTLSFSLPASHPKASAIAVERAVEAAGELYRIRRIETSRDGGPAMLDVHCEARWYDLRVAGQIAEREWESVQAGTVLEHILKGKEWTVGTVNVSTRRTWQMESGTTLACLRAVAEVHGGDLVFDNEARTVSLLTFSGKDRGVAFFHGRGLSSIRRVEDTTTLLTRIIPINEEGVGISAVNGGVPYLEDFTWTNEVRTGEYRFASGTSPLTMLSMSEVNLAKRSRPSLTYEATVVDMSAWTGQAVDRFDVGDRIVVVDEELGIETTQRVVALEYDLLRPWESRITLSEKLRSLGSGQTAVEAGVLDTGFDMDTRDLVPFNLLLNGRFDNGLAHWAASGVTVVEGGVTGRRSAQFKGSGVRWIEQTVATDTRDAYTLSMQVEMEGGPQGWVPEMIAQAEIVYDDGTTETITLDLA